MRSPDDSESCRNGFYAKKCMCRYMHRFVRLRIVAKLGPFEDDICEARLMPTWGAGRSGSDPSLSGVDAEMRERRGHTSEL